MKFRDEQIQQRFDSIMSLQAEGLPNVHRPIVALMSAYGWFGRSCGWQSPQVQEIIEHLLSAELRPALRSWYLKFNDNSMNPVALEFRERLSALAGEKFG